MIKHIVAWNHQAHFTPEERDAHAERIRAGLEALPTQCGGPIPGIVSLRVHARPYPGSTRDMVLDSVFDGEKALAEYQAHPAHKLVSAFVGSVMCDRVCLDYAV